MNLVRATLNAVFFLRLGCRCEAVEGRTTVVTPASSTNVLLEQNITLLRESFSITSNVPVTILRTQGGDQYWSGGCQEYAARPEEGTIVVTSDCNTDQTTIVPSVSLDESEDEWGRTVVDVISVTLPDINDAPVDFLEPSTVEIHVPFVGNECLDCETGTLSESAPASGAFATRSFAFCMIGTLARSIAAAARASNGRENNEQQQRVLDTTAQCKYNVEIFINGCEHTVNVTSPNARTADATVTIDSQEDGFAASFSFLEEQMKDLGEVADAVIPPNYGSECGIMCVGRPYVDASGRSLLATTSSIAAFSDCGECSLLSSGDIMKTDRSGHVQVDVEPTKNELLLGEEWTKSALGEHASVASFAAFSIALMTNNGPADLVEAALRAGLDEIRHAKVSFEIASKLTGQDVGPGPLPESKQEFRHDLKELAMAVAREGCIEETLSAIYAAAEVELIDRVLETGADRASNVKFLNVTHTTLAWIRDELYNIALDESNHSALAWRTVKWVCTVDNDVCQAVNDMVLEEERLEVAFQRRFGGIVMDDEFRGSLRAVWRKIYSAHNSCDVSGNVCMTDELRVKNVNNSSLVTYLADNILKSILCYGAMKLPVVE